MSEFRKSVNESTLRIGGAHLSIAGCAEVPTYNLELRTYTPFTVVYEDGHIASRVRSAYEPATFELSFSVNSRVLHSGHLWFVRYTNENHIRYSLRVVEMNLVFNGPISLEGIDNTAFESMTYQFVQRGGLEDQKIPERIETSTPVFVDGRPIPAKAPKVVPIKFKRKVSFD